MRSDRVFDGGFIDGFLKHLNKVACNYQHCYSTDIVPYMLVKYHVLYCEIVLQSKYTYFLATLKQIIVSYRILENRINAINLKQIFA